MQTGIELDPATLRRLDCVFKRKGESYSEVLWRLMDCYYQTTPEEAKHNDLNAIVHDQASEKTEANNAKTS